MIRAKNPDARSHRAPGKDEMATALLIAHVLGIVSSFDSLMRTRTSPGAIAWIVALNTFPLLSVPAYWIFGRTKFHGYRLLRQQVDVASSECIGGIRKKLHPFAHDVSGSHNALAGAQLAKLDYLTGNAVELLVDGHKTFESILAGIDHAQEYVLVQFFIIHCDEIGSALRDRLMARARAGVRVWLLYDEIGCKDLAKTEQFFGELFK